MRLDEKERKALKFALERFVGEVYIFGSRNEKERKGGDIDLLLVPKKAVNPIKLSLEVQRKFFSQLEEDIDVVVYDGGEFSKEVLRNAERIDIKRI